MTAVDFILNLAALLLWLGWRSKRLDQMAPVKAATLAGTLKPAAYRPWPHWPFWAGLALLLLTRAWVYHAVGSPTDWTPKLQLGLVVPAFRSDQFLPSVLYSALSFLRVFIIFYFWLLFLAAINRHAAEPDPIHRLIRLHLGFLARWPWPLQLLIPVLTVAALWMGLHPMLVRLEITASPTSSLRLAQQGLLLGVGLFFTLKYLLSALLFLYLVVSYVYLGSNPFWDFVTAASRNVLAWLRWAPLRIGKLDLAPLVGVTLIFLILHWAPSQLLAQLAQHRILLWPQ